MIPPPPTWGRVGVGEASDGRLTPKRGFPLPDLPHLGGGGLNTSSFICDCFALGGRILWICLELIQSRLEVKFGKGYARTR
jgi:hypothetical protein